MWSWIIVVVLYALGMGLFHLLGGLAAAGEALERWGRTSSVARLKRASPGGALERWSRASPTAGGRPEEHQA